MTGGVAAAWTDWQVTCTDKTVCISHKEDLEGVGAAAITRQAYGGDTVPVNYSDMAHTIWYVNASEPDLKRLFICDLGLDAEMQDDFMRLMNDLIRRRVVIKLYGCGTAVALIKLYYIF